MKKFSVVKIKSMSERKTALPDVELCLSRMESRVARTAMVVMKAQQLQSKLSNRESWDKGVMAG